MQKRIDRIHGSLAAACIADALGAPTEERSIAEIKQLWSYPIDQFYAPPQDSPYAVGRAAAQYTDDSSQLIMLAETIIADNGEVRPASVAKMIIEWSKKPEYFPHFAGPSTRAAVEELKAGRDPWEVGKAGRIMTQGSSNGGAMRVAPAGLVNPGDIEASAKAAFLTCVPSHNTNAGVAGAAAIAGAVSMAMVDGASLLDVVWAARDAAQKGDRLGSEQGRSVPAPSVASRIELAAKIAITARSFEDAVDEISNVIGTGLPAAEAVPAAIGFFLAANGDPWRTAQMSASAGGDSDTVGCMAASIAGAFAGIQGVPQPEYKQVTKANNINLEDLARRLNDVVN